MNIMLDTNQYNLARTAIFKCPVESGPFEIEYIQKTVNEVANFFGYGGDLTNVIRYVESKVNCKMDLGTSVVSAEAEHDKDWIKQITAEEKIYATSYEHYLRDKGMAPGVVNSISRVNDNILSLLGNPKTGNYVFQRRGLVIGDVQSGKTSNYLSLLTKAADAGYRFIIVIAGIHNNLRSQTQQRIDEGFVGRVSGNDRKKTPIGAALQFDGQFPHPASFTTVDQDFNKKLADSIATEISDFNKPVILVIKKNVSTLRSLYDWLVNFNMEGAKSNGRINVPMLLIDDEADNASINTNNPELDPTKTNNYIRTILSSFNQASYVGYTATPFANIFIDPESYTGSNEDLFPKDFIYNLDAPTNYFGAKKIFLDKEFNYVHVPLESSEIGQYLPLKHKKTFIVHGIPASMKEAICCFLITKCIRNLRLDSKAHCSMLINVSTYVDVQKQIKEKILDYLTDLGNEIIAFSGMYNAFEYEHIAFLNQIFKKYYQNSLDFNQNIIEWDQISNELRKTFDDSIQKDYIFKTCVVNSKSQDSLDYAEQRNSGLMVIAIGGFSLSRGLTIEGLTVSYFYRSTQMYDTLLQMGRWFGYRPQYEDLCRIYMSEEAYSWYEHITMAAEDVRVQIARMNQLKKTPKDFGLYVKASDLGLIITARNKMQTAQGISLNRSFSGQLKEQTTFTINDEAHEKNYNTLEVFWKKISSKYIPKMESTGIFFQDVEISKVIELLAEYKFGASSNWLNDKIPPNQVIMEAVARYIVEIQSKYPFIDVIFRSKNNTTSEVCSFENIKAVERNHVRWLDNQHQHYILNRSRLGSDKDEKIGLNTDIINKIEKPTAKNFREIRNKPLMICYLVELRLQENEMDEPQQLRWSKEINKGFPALSFSFPFGDEEKEVQIYANRIYIDSYKEEEEDFLEEA